jgi:hypothetical protein
MPRKPEGERRLTVSERVSRHRQRKTEQAEALRLALERVYAAKTIREARDIATLALIALDNRGVP